LLPTMGAATPVGVLRALDRFDLISWQGTTYPIARAILAGIAFAAGAPFEVYVGIWFITDLSGDIYFWFLAWRELRRRGLLKGIRPTLRPTTLPGAWRFAIHVNLTSSLITAWGPIARLVVGGLLGPSAAALFRVASSLADSAQKPADFLSKAFYPEVVRMDLTTKHPWKLMFRSAVFSGLIASVAVLLLLIGGQPLVSLIFGKEFLGAYPILMVLIIAPVIGIFSFPLPSMLYALDRPDAPLKARLFGTIIYFGLIAPLCWSFGVMGAAVAFVLAYASMGIALAFQVRAEYRRVRAKR
ncbi:MAG TPA: polysaccharide biosynthesis C-terminal domain-containing protein, partial [Sphingomicrobium sp.]